MTKYLSVTDTAKLVRAALKAGFPGVKFSVRSDSYSGGASIRVCWTDGPFEKDVDKIANRYQGADFDGMQDMKIYRDGILLAAPDGTVEEVSTPRAALHQLASDGHGLTPVKASYLITQAVHLAFDHGTYDSKPLCGTLSDREVETTDECANCGRCATVAYALGLDYLLKDHLGWTGIYQPRQR